jgi:hypothetical protein
MRLLQIHFDRPVQFHLQSTTLDRGGEIGFAGAGNGRGCSAVIQLERILQGYFKVPFLTGSIGCSRRVTRRQVRTYSQNGEESRQELFRNGPVSKRKSGVIK